MSKIVRSMKCSKFQGLIALAMKGRTFNLFFTTNIQLLKFLILRFAKETWGLCLEDGYYNNKKIGVVHLINCSRIIIWKIVTLP